MREGLRDVGPGQADHAFAIRNYFADRCLEWSRGPTRVKVGDSSVKSAMLVAAVFRLTNCMHWSGKLVDDKGRPRLLDGEHGLVAIMGVSKSTALKVFAVLRADRSMVEDPRRDESGYVRASERRLQVPSNLSKRSSTNVDLGQSESLSPQIGVPESTNGGSSVHVSDRDVVTASERKREEQEEGFMSGDTATSGNISHQEPDPDREEATGLRGTPAPSDSTTGSVEGHVGSGDNKRVRVMAAWETRTEWPDGPDGEPCYAHLDTDQWESIRRQLPHDRLFRLREGEVEMTAIGSRLTLWFRYGYHLKVAKGDGPLLRSLIREELGPDIVVELLPMSERVDLVVVA